MTDDITKLSFCDITFLDDSIVEVAPYKNCHIEDKEVVEFHDFFDSLQREVGVLVNRKNVYSYSFFAQTNIANHENITAVCIYIPNPDLINNNKYIAKTIVSKTPIKVFTEHDIAEVWLRYLTRKENI